MDQEVVDGLEESMVDEIETLLDEIEKEEGRPLTDEERSEYLDELLDLDEPEDKDWASVANADCGTGAGGFKNGNTCSRGLGLPRPVSKVFSKIRARAGVQESEVASKVLDSARRLTGRTVDKTPEELVRSAEEIVQSSTLYMNFDPGKEVKTRSGVKTLVDALVEDPYLRNMHEVGFTGGHGSDLSPRSKKYRNLRSEWEKSAFGDLSGVPTDYLPKYASLEVGNRLTSGNVGYGSAMIIFHKSPLAGRSTISFSDTSRVTSVDEVAMFDRPAGAILRNEGIARQAAGVPAGDDRDYRPLPGFHFVFTKPEVQIWGPLKLDPDTVSEIRVLPKYLRDPTPEEMNRLNTLDPTWADLKPGEARSRLSNRRADLRNWLANRKLVALAERLGIPVRSVDEPPLTTHSASNCGTGAGGFKKGNKCAAGKGKAGVFKESGKAARVESIPTEPIGPLKPPPPENWRQQVKEWQSWAKDPFGLPPNAKIRREPRSRDRGHYSPDVHADPNNDGVTDAARVGVPAMDTPPPPPIPRMPNLTPHERYVENEFREAFHRNPNKMAADFLNLLKKNTKPGDPITFGTDDAKVLSGAWEHVDLKKRSKNRATLNVALHQTANAVAKRAFVEYLDTLKPGDEIMVTVGGCGCHEVGELIMLSDGSSKMVEDIEVGDELMGPDSLPREVLKLIRGRGKMYRITPKKGKSFVVNGSHVLSLITNRGPGTGRRTKKIRVEMTVDEYLGRAVSFQRSCLLHRTGVDFDYAPVALDPYYLGIWLGNGTHSLPSVTTQDHEVVKYIEEFAEQFPGTEVVVNDKDTLVEGKPNKSKDYKIALLDKAPGKGRVNPVTVLLREIGVFKNKHIPASYLRNDRNTRLKLLAGLLDTDGCLGNGCFEFLSKDERLAYDVTYLARSLGLAAYVKPKWIKTDFIDEERQYWRVSIHGDTDQIPTLVSRKQAGPRRINKDVLRVGFKIEPVGVGDYYGFTLSGDGLYLMGDFTVTHNSGKGYALGKDKDGKPFVPMAAEVKKRVKAVWDSAGDQNATENPWIQALAEKRGLKVNYVYVHADAKNQWAHPERGVVKRAGDPKDGRMVDADVFADSYAIGARNHQAFYERHKDNPRATFIFLQNIGGTPKQLPGIPPEALNLDRNDLAAFARKTIIKSDAPPHVVRGGTIGARIWGAKRVSKKN